MSEKHYKLKELIMPNRALMNGEYADRMEKIYLQAKRGPNFQPKRKKRKK